MNPTQESCPGANCSGNRPLMWSRIYVNRRTGEQLDKPFERLFCGFCGFERMIGDDVGRVPERGN